MVPFEYIRASNVEHALSVLSRHGRDARVLAGGTDLLVELKTHVRGPRVIVDISRIGALKRIELTADGLRIGALATHSEIACSELIRRTCPALAEAAQAIGAVQTRNAGTIAGNLVTCVPSMDSGPPLLALDAQVVLASERGLRVLPVGDFFVGPRCSAIKPDELLTCVEVPRSSLGKPMAFLKLGLRKGQALALVNVAAGFFANGDPGHFSAPCIALGAVAPTVIRATEAERYLSERAIGSAAIAKAACIATREAAPIDDFRASAWYRSSVITVLVRRALEIARERAMQPVLEQVA
jgi:CO/xanthine dehydrogenase FAD-binding subunit